MDSSQGINNGSCENNENLHAEHVEHNEDLLISKKDLLNLEGISYGQLYRWKRKNIIPEDWFIRKSTFTGQETFFPRKQILDRVGKIRSMKENLSLDELAEIFSNVGETVDVSNLNIVKENVVSEISYKFYNDNYKEVSKPDFLEVLQIFIVDELLTSGDISQDEVKMYLNLVKKHAKEFEGVEGDVIFTRKLGVSNCFLVTDQAKFFFEDKTKLIKTISLSKTSEVLKSKLIGGQTNE